MSIIGACRFDGSCASGTVSSAAPVRRASTAGRRPGSWSAPTRSRTGSRRSRCPTWSGRGPGALEAAGDRVVALAGAERVLPAEALLLDRRAFGLAARRARSASAAPWALPKVWPPAISATVSSSFIAMRRERLADVAGRGERIGVAVRALRVHVDQAHLHGAERVGELAVAAVALVAEPGVLGTPVDVLLGLPDVARGRRRSRRS